MSWREYGEDRKPRLADLKERIQRGAYRALPSRRVYIPKPDGRQRPLGIAALEDKIVQRAVVEVLNVIWEGDFLGFSYGFRPGRGAHDALGALYVGITRRPVNWIVDADIAGFFDTVRHDRLIRFVEQRVGDRRIVRLIGKWLKAGVMEDGVIEAGEAGTPQGAVISPLLATSTCTTFSISGRIVGAAARRRGRSSWCVMPTTSSPGSSTGPMPSGSWRRCAGAWARSG